VGPVVPLGIPNANDIVLELYETVGVEPAGKEGHQDHDISPFKSSCSFTQ